MFILKIKFSKLSLVCSLFVEKKPSTLSHQNTPALPPSYLFNFLDNQSILIRSSLNVDLDHWENLV